MDFRQQFEQKLIEKAMKDDSFRKLLIENPGAAIEAETGMKIPEAFKIRVLEEDPQTVYLVLPQNPSVYDEKELSDAESARLQKELDEREGRTSTPVSGTKVALSAVGGFIPGLGAVTNMVNASDHYRNEDRLKPYENQDRLKSKQKTI